MTQPDQGYDIPVSLNTDGVVSGAQQGEDAINGLQAAFAGLTIGAVAAGRGLSKVSESAGRNLFGSASLTAAADFQKQMSGIAAVAAVTGQSLSQFRGTVDGLARSMPGGTQQAIATVAAVQQLGLAAKNQQPQIRALSVEFTRLGAAVGESAPGMATSFGQLNRELASLDPSRLSRFADVLTTLHATSGASAASIIGFSQAIGPVSQAAGLGESSILGISTAFTKLGDDGGAAATAINKILTDLNSSVREGSNTMVAYANATGLTVKQFRALYEANPAAALTKVTGALATAGPQAPYLLQTLGLDPTRTQRALLELSQSGGLQAQIQTAVGAYGNGNTQKAAAAAFNNVDDKMQVLGTTAGQLSVALGAPLLKPFGVLVGLVSDLARPLASIAGSPVGQIGMSALAYGLVGGRLGGAALKGIGPLGTTALGFGGLTSGPVASFLGGRRTALYGAEGALYNEGSFGAKHYNSMIDAGIAGEQMGGPVMRGTNRRIFDLSQGIFSAYGGPGGRAAQPLMADAIAADTPGMSRVGRIARTAYGGAGLGFGGYLRLAGAPFKLAGQNAMDRNFTATTEGGPTRNLMNALKDGGWKDTQVTGKALGDFTKELQNTNQVLPRLRASLLQYAGAVGGFGLQSGVGVARAGGSLASKAAGGLAGFAMDNPLLAVGGAALIGYEGYKGAQTYNQTNAASYQNQDIYSTLDQYRDAMGRAGVATQTMAQQILAASTAIGATITTHRQAATVSPADLQALGTPNPAKVVRRYTGTTSQVAAQISAENLNGMQPQDLQAVKNDLLNQGYSASQVDAILKQVPASGSGQLSGGQIGSLVSHIANNTGGNIGGFKSLFSANALKGYATGTYLDSSNTWKMLGHAGGGHPELNTQATTTLHELVGAVGQGYSNNIAAGRGTRYSQQSALVQANKIMNAAIATHDAATTVATEQALTASLTGTKSGITGVSAADIVKAGGLSGLIAKHGDKVYGATIASLGGPLTAQHQTPQYITALQGQARNVFGQFYGGGSTGIAGQVSRATATPEDIGLMTKTAISVVQGLTASGTSLDAIATAAAKSLNTTSVGQLAVQQAVLAQAQYQQGTKQIGMTQGQLFSAQTSQAAGLLSATGTNSQAQYQQGQQLAQSTLQNLTSYYQQRIMAQYNYQIEAGRAQADFNLSMSRGEQDFQIQSLRNQQDYLLQLKRNIQDAEVSDYNPYQRIDAQPVFSAGELSENLASQNSALIAQKQNLAKARADGLTGAAINVLGLAQTANAQQLQELITDFASDPNVINQINKEIGKRGGAASALYKDTGDVTYQRQKQDFDIQTGRLQADFSLQQSRAEQDFQIQSTRMAQDLHDQDLQITGNMTTLQKDMVRVLHGQTVNWTTSLVDMMSQTINKMKGKVPELQSLANSAFGSAGSGSGAGSSTTAEHPVTGTPSGYHREASGVNQGFLLTGQSNPGTDMNPHGNPDLHWGKDVSKSPGKKHLSSNAKLAKQMAGPWGKGVEWDALYQIWEQESGFSTTAGLAEPGHAYGIPQAYWSSKGGSAPMSGEGSDWLSNPRTQINWGLSYIQNRYGDPLGAWAHKSRTGWYNKGGIAFGPQMMGIGEGGTPEMALPLNQQGMKFLLTTMKAYIGADDARTITSGGQAMAISINHNTYHYDSRVQLTGPATFVASDPDAIGKALAKKQRVDNLTGNKGGPGD